MDLLKDVIETFWECNTGVTLASCVTVETLICVSFCLSVSCRCLSGLSAGSYVRLAVLQTALPSAAGPRQPQASASQR